MTRGLVAAGAIVALANGLALTGVAYNRSSVVERVELTEAELPPLGYSATAEGATELRLNWLMGVDAEMAPFSEAQLRAVGFDLPAASSSAPERGMPLARAVIVAIDASGTARQQWFESARALTTGTVMLPASRLVVIDMGRDLASMLTAHPDSSRTLVLHGLVQPQPSVGADGVWVWRGGLATLLPNTVHVPREMRDALTARRPPDDQPRYVVTLLIGRRGEPWIESVRPR
jgi:hypothetical protein